MLAIRGREMSMIAFFHDLRFAARQLVKTPVFTVTILVTLALGIGANAAIFALINSVLLRDLPVVDPHSLVRIGDNSDCCVNSGSSHNGDYGLFSTDIYLHLRQALPEFQDLAAMQAGFEYRPLTARREGSGALARSVMGEFVSGNYFRTLGIRPASGRLFQDSDDTEGVPVTAVLSYDSWQHLYAGDPSIVGSTFYMNTRPVTIVGIAPQGFYGDRLSSMPPEFYLPIESMGQVAGAPYLHDPDVNWIYLVGRLQPGVSLPALQSKIGVLLRQELSVTKTYAEREGKEYLPKVHVVLTPAGGGLRFMQDAYKSALTMLTWIAAMVLLVACANIANLLLVRGMSRKGEMSIRSALGAQRGRIVRQLLTESTLLAACGGIMGLGVAYSSTRLLLAVAFPGAQDDPIDPSPSLLVIGFAFALSLFTGIVFGVAPAWIAARTQPIDALRSGTRTTSPRASLLQRGLVVLQAALSLILIVVAGLFSQSLLKQQNTDLHLDARNRYIVHISPQSAGYAPHQVEALYHTMEDRFHALPGIVHVGLATYTPMEENNWGMNMQIQGEPNPHKGASYIKANAEYFDSVGTRVLMGRGIAPQDDSSAPAVAVVNQTFVRQFFKPGVNPIGHRMGAPGPMSPGDYEIVGVVDDTIYNSVGWHDHSMFFLPIAQRPSMPKEPIDQDISLYAGAIVLEADRPMDDMEKLTASTLASINPNLTIVKFESFEDQISDRFHGPRIFSRLTMLFGALALLLATLGLYGITAYAVARRTSEIGIRIALGARRASIVSMFLQSAMLQAAIGLTIGIPAALACVRLVKSELYEITTVSPVLLATSAAILSLAAAVAGIIPARRAASIEPVETLRIE
jgi:predicted permease